MRRIFIAIIFSGALFGELEARAQCTSNPTVCENQLLGELQSVWDPGTPSPTIRGFTGEISYNKGENITFHVQTPGQSGVSYQIVIYRLGYYAGRGARLIASNSPLTSVAQPACTQTAVNVLDPNATGYRYLLDCGNWSTAWTWASPTTLVSGLYMARLRRFDTNAVSPIFFVIRDDARNSDVLLQTADTTWHAYNSGPVYAPTGEPGRSVYDVYETRAYKVSYRRPHTWIAPDHLTGGGAHVTGDNTNGYVFGFGEEYSLIRFLERNGYDVAYFTGRDADQRGSLILNHRLYVTSGHDEYWSGAQMTNIQAARDAGVNLAFFSGNTAYWKIRWEDNYHTMVTYKEWAPDKLDPLPGVTTGLFRDPAFGPANGYDGYRPENQLIGIMTVRPSSTDENLVVPEPDGKMRFWRNTSVALLGTGQTATFGDLLLGYEIDGDVDNGFRPPGLFYTSTTNLLNQPGSSFELGTAETPHNMTIYRAPSGALVFHSGTMRLQRHLAWYYNKTAMPGNPDRRLQQAIVNLFADMNVQPGSIESGLSAASISTDTVAPTAQISSPSGSTQVKQLDTVVVLGTAADSGGGRVAAVEVSVDGGTTWHPASGRESWSYSFTPCATGAYSLRARAVDDSGRLGAASTAVAINASAAATPDFVNNGKFECGFATDGTGNGWWSHANSGTPMQRQNAGQIAGVNMQRIVAGGSGDGVGQHLTLIPGRAYMLRARVFAESGRALLQIGKAGQANDVGVATSANGRWENLSLVYQPTQAACTFVIYSDLGAATFKIDDVSLTDVAALIANGDFSLGHDTINDSHGTGSRGQSWWHWSNSGHVATFSANTLIPGNNMQRVTLASVAGSYSDGIGQHLLGTLAPNTTYTLNARIYVVSGTVQLRIGQLYAANDLSRSTVGTGAWQNVTLFYTTGGAQTSGSVAIYGVAASTSFYVDDVTLVPGIAPPNLAANGAMEDGFTTVNDAHGTGARANGFWHWGVAGSPMTLSQHGAAGDYEQRIVAPVASAGIGQHVMLDQSRTYTLRATVTIESGQVDLRIGLLYAADTVHVYSSGTGTQTLTATYTNPSAGGALNTSFAIYSTIAGSTFRVDDVRLTVNP